MLMSGDNLHDPQPNIRYNVNVHHHEEWEAMSLTERMKVMTPAIKNWENEYLKENKDKLSKLQIDILQGRELKSNEGMIYGQMYADWKTQKGFNLE
tara:strand:+ start:314 stop:601 length:288 start_codon:yes stop_codon:yes gene_type:complete